MIREFTISNAKIRRTQLGIEDHGIMTCYLNLDLENGSCQGAGGYALDEPVHVDGQFVGRYGTAAGMQFIMRLLETVDAESWETLPGKHIKVKHNFNEVRAIAHILKDNWFDFKEFFAAHKDQEQAVK